jgi:hypothetical protein
VRNRHRTESCCRGDALREDGKVPVRGDRLLLALLVAAITLAFLDNRGRLCASVGRQGAAYIIAFFELAALASTDVPFVTFVRLDQFAWHHTLL